ncbi:MAG TPA: hypothetical protein VNI20_07220 [Fimbriimonadaceae bacterium]|nr:hypothetical protein [Fimbriimonadaceae bacterium]
MEPSALPTGGKGRIFASLLRKTFLSPGTIFFFALALTERYWVSALTYLLLRSFLFDPRAILAWATVVLGVAALLTGIVIAFRGAHRAQVARRLGRTYWISTWFIVLLLGAPIAAVAYAAVVAWNEVQAEAAITRTNPNIELRSKLSKMEERGIFTWANTASSTK